MTEPRIVLTDPDEPRAVDRSCPRCRSLKRRSASGFGRPRLICADCGQTLPREDDEDTE